MSYQNSGEPARTGGGIPAPTPTPWYGGLFLRKSLGQVPNWTPTGGLWDASPDVACAGTTPLADPSSLAETYDQAAPSDSFVVGLSNYIYVRAVNTEPNALTARIWLFWVPSGSQTWPTNWQSDGITVDGVAQNYQDVSATAAPKWTNKKVPPETSPAVVTTTPFVVQVGQQGMSADGISLVAIVDNTQPPAETPPLPAAFASIGALSQWVSAQDGVGWSNTTIQKAALTSTTPVAGAGRIRIGAEVQGLPPDAMLVIQCAGPQGQAIDAQVTPWSTAFTALQTVDWGAAGYTSTLNILAFAGATPLAEGAAVAAVVLQLPGG